MKKILGIGNALVDVLTILDDDSLLDKYDLPKGSMQLVDSLLSEQLKIETSHLKRSMAAGGSAANTINGLAMLGAETAFIGSTGNDETGTFFENDMKKAGIRTFLLKHDSVTGTALTLISKDSERTFATHLGAAVELNAEDLEPFFFGGYDILYLEGYLIYNRPLVDKACTMARSRNMKIALDLASYNVVGTNLDAFNEIVGKYADIVFANEDEAKALTGEEPEKALQIIAQKCEIAVVKVGSEGSWIKRGDEIIKIGTSKVNTVDTTGAGDLYASGFLYGYCRNENLELCGQYGSLTAGNVIEILGARMDDKRWEKIRHSIAECR